MRVLVIGSGGREHAICRAFSTSTKITKLYCANGNAGIAQLAECVDIKPDDIAALTAFARDRSIDLTFVGGETPLALGIVDEFEKHGFRIVGPTAAAARLEASKAFAKDFMARHGVPTAKYVTALSPAAAVSELVSGAFGDENAPVVVKADGLAAGKGVVVAENRAVAIAAINEMADLVGAHAAEKIVLEECMFGREVSLLMFADGEDFALMSPTRDHKRIGEGDTGPNTGGMGTFTDATLLTPDQLALIADSIIGPTLRGCQTEGFRFRGILFLGLMLTDGGPKLLEYNVRFGDPETQSILIRLETDLIDICEAMIDGTLGQLEISWRKGNSACIILAAQNYPAKPRTGDLIYGVAEAAAMENVEVFHAGTSASAIGEFYTAGGRVLGVTATGDDLTSALASAYAAAGKIKFEGMQFRRDIGK